MRFVVALAVVSLMILGCQASSGTDVETGYTTATLENQATALPSLSPTASPSDIPPLDTTQILNDFRRLRKGCALSSAVDASGESLGTPLSVILLEFSQEDDTAYRRAFGSSSLTRLAQRASISLFCEFKGVELITNFFADLPFDQAFGQYSADPPSSEKLATELNRILAATEANPRGAAGSRFEEVFPIPELAVFAATQLVCPNFLNAVTNPVCNSEYTPRLRERVMDQWLNRIAQNPEQYQSRDGILNIFEEFRQEGRFNPIF